MKRYCSLEDISDGKLYNKNDLVEASCNGCKGGASCCHGMGNSIILDPYDIYRMTCNLNMTFEQLLINKIELNMVDGMILPNLKMGGEAESCAFLNERGKCSIHEFRPGICRIFPLGRYYSERSFQYFLQVHECNNNSKTKVKVSKWIDTPNLDKNEKFVSDWHYYLCDIENKVNTLQDDNSRKKVIMYVLNLFYVMKYDTNRDFYDIFHERLNQAKLLEFMQD